MTALTPTQRRELRAKAHHLHPVVIVGHHGLTAAVLHEIDVNLLAHELIKVRVFSEDREQREAMLERICAALDAASVQHIGRLLVLWRPAPEKAEAQRPTATHARTARTGAPSPEPAQRQRRWPSPHRRQGARAVRWRARPRAQRRRAHRPARRGSRASRPRGVAGKEAELVAPERTGTVDRARTFAPTRSGPRAPRIRARRREPAPRRRRRRSCRSTRAQSAIRSRSCRA